MHFSRKTKIVATIGPASESPEVLSRLIEEGIDAARLNFSHDTHEGHARRIALIRKLEAKTGRSIAIIADLQGPKIRIGNLPDQGVFLREGSVIILDTAPKAVYREGIIPLPSSIFQKGVLKGSEIFLDDGTFLLEIVAVRGPQFTAKVLRGGTLYTRKGVNVPSLVLREKLFGSKDRADILFAKTQGIDYLSLSFLRNKKDILEARKLLGNSPVKIIAKIERPEALDHIYEIIEAADAVMVARGDLGIETPLWELPVRQKEIIEKAHQVMKPVIVATQMLQSMTKNPIPTRAEVSDVANAVYDSTDAVMLSAESASGNFPVESVRMMRNILEETEKHTLKSWADHHGVCVPIHLAVAKSTKYIAAQIGAKVILAGTVTGLSPRAVSHYRPLTPIVALAENDFVARSLALVWGITPVVLKNVRSVEGLAQAGITFLKKKGLLKAGDPVVFLSGATFGVAGQTNNISVMSA